MREALTALLREVGVAHQQEVLSQVGNDPEWPLWMSERLQAPLNELLGTSLSRSQIVFLLLTANGEQRLHAPACDWPSWYAGWLMARYRIPEGSG